MKNLNILFFYIFLTFSHLNLKSEASLIVSSSSPFPHAVESMFNIKFSIVKIYPPFTIMTIQIIDKNTNNELSKISINPGIHDKIQNKNIGDNYMKLTNWFKNGYNQLVLDIQFYKLANYNILKICYIEAETKDERDTALQESQDKNVAYKEEIKLYINPILNIEIKTPDERKDGVHDGGIAIVSCQAKDGIPPESPTIYFHEFVKETKNQFDPSSNTQTVVFNPNLFDHGKTVSCSAGKSKKELKINVFHHPNKLRLDPTYSSYLTNGSSVICYPANGFPIPQVVYWTFIFGPQNASSYYTISKNNLTMLPNAPFGSTWIFNCTAENSIPNSYKKGITKNYAFDVGPIPKLHVAVITVLVIFLILFVVGLVIFFLHKKGILAKLKWKGKTKSPDTEDQEPNNNLKSIYTFQEMKSDESFEEKQNNNNNNLINKRKKPKPKPRSHQTDHEMNTFV